VVLGRAQSGSVDNEPGILYIVGRVESVEGGDHTDAVSKQVLNKVARSNVLHTGEGTGDRIGKKYVHGNVSDPRCHPRPGAPSVRAFSYGVI